MWEDNDDEVMEELGDIEVVAGPSGGSGKGVGRLDALFLELMQECKLSAPGARLSALLRTALERLYPEQREELVSRTKDDCAPLFVASRRGNVEIVEYLISVCNAPLEQRGLYCVAEERAMHRVSPLWCAAVAGHVGVLRALADAGADVDAPSDSGSTPVRSACFMTHMEVVRFLVSRGADIHRANHNGGTCLINSVQSAPLCAFLLSHGAKVDAQDLQLKSALQYAVQEQRMDTARLLLQHGADPRLPQCSGDTALRTAALKGGAALVALLCAHPAFADDAAARADAYELLGATLLEEFNDLSAALSAWRRATAMRHLADGGYLEKRPEVGPHEALGGAREWRSRDELEAAAGDVDELRTQALLVVVRVLGERHKDAVFRLMYRGASYADAFRYQRCISLWSWALQIRIARDTLLYTDTCQTACALTRLLLDAWQGRLEARGVQAPPAGPPQEGGGLPRHQDVLQVFDLIANSLLEARQLLAVRPVHRKQAETFDRALRCLTHLTLLLLHTAAGEQQHEQVRVRVARLVRLDVRSAHTGDTLLHLCVSRLNVIRSTYFADDLAGPGVFPCARVVRLLTSLGASARVRNCARSTPLHVASIPYNFSTELVESLLAADGHLDQPNRFNDSAAQLVSSNRASRVRVLRHVTLACLAARALLASRRPLQAGDIPASLMEFVDLHRAE